MITLVTLVLKASEIPDDTIVRKVTSNAEFVLRKELGIYVEGDKEKKQVVLEDMVFLISHNGNGNVNAVHNDKKLAVDLELVDAIELLQELQFAIEERNDK